MFWRTKFGAVYCWRARAAALTGASVLAVMGCATSSETRNAPEAAPASATAPVTPEPAPAAAPGAGNAAGKADDADFATLADAEAALERARTDLSRLALLDRPSEVAEAPAAAAPPAPKGRASREAESSGDERRSEKKAARPAAKPAPVDGRFSAEAGPAKSEDPCEMGCKAFASLLRAKAAVCRLDTPGGGRCSRAEEIAREAEVRVRSCGCPQ